MRLHIALQEGFRGEPVVVTAGERELFRKTNVKTKTQIGLADSFEISINESAVSVAVSLPGRNMTKSAEVDLTSDVYVGVSVTAADDIRFTIQREPFGYV